MEYKAASSKVMVLGIDGMDPRLTKIMIEKGNMPNLKEFIARGSAREDLMMLGAQPTVTPPMWTTLSTGAYPMTHGITCFFRKSDLGLDYMEYNLDSRYCLAEQIWNVTAEAGKKTLVYTWPGCSWPPTSDSDNLFVVDGTHPGCPNTSVGRVDYVFIELASTEAEKTLFQPKLASNGHVPCVIDDLKEVNGGGDTSDKFVGNAPMNPLIIKKEDGEGGFGKDPYNGAISTIKPAEGWVNAPVDAKEFTLLYSSGLIRRPALILKNPEGIYDKVEVYKSKKEKEPLYTLRKGIYEAQNLDEAIKDDKIYRASRDICILEMAEDGSSLKLWVSDAIDVDNNLVWKPKELYAELINKFGYLNFPTQLGILNKQILLDGMLASWEQAANWQADAINYLIKEKGIEVVFSHFHNVDCMGHAVWKHMNGKENAPITVEDVAEIVDETYKQTDRYIGKYMHLLDEDWTILLISDHGQVCSEHEALLMGDNTGVNVKVLKDLGYTVLKTDAQGNDIYEIDWKKTRAIAPRGNHIYINLKGRDPYGIVDPTEKYLLEEQIMTDLYGYKNEVTGHRMIALALRNRDAALLGMSGPDCGDIIYFNAEGYNNDHCDSISTTYGVCDTSVSPIFAASGKGIKAGYTTTRWIREVDIAPTVAALLGLRMPNECEGAPVYQIIEYK